MNEGHRAAHPLSPVPSGPRTLRTSNPAPPKMPFAELVRMALDALRASKLRAALTLLGIVIGVFAIIVSVTAVGVIEQSVTGTIESFGSTKFTVYSRPAVEAESSSRRRAYAEPLTYGQALLLRERTRRPTGIAPETSEEGARFRTADAATDPNVQVLGSNEFWTEANGFEVARGRFLTDADVQFARPVVVLGADVADALFGDRDPVGQAVAGDRGRYQVVGVLASKGETFGMNPDQIAVVPITRLFMGYGRPDRDLVVHVIAADVTDIAGTTDEVIGALRGIRGVRPGEDNTFEVETNESLVDGFREVAGAVSLGGAAIGLLTLLAAGIGIMNIMLVSVTERTREIGVRKSLGARRRDVLRQFLVEAVVLCQVGGVVGVVLGIGVANLLTLAFDTSLVVPWVWVAVAFVGVSLFGITFGVYPAWKAARLDPIEALRYE